MGGALALCFGGSRYVDCGDGAAFRVQPKASCLGISITVAALFVMPLIASGKRKMAKTTNKG